MKKIIFIFFSLITFFIFTGCTKNEATTLENVPANLKEITGKIIPATLNDDGNIVIDENEITNEVSYISYEYEGVIIGLLAVRDTNNDVKVVINTCNSCGGSPYAYFVQVDNYLQCQNCGSLFAIDDLDDLSTDGCNPIAILDRKDADGKIIIGADQLKELKDKFINWKGPK